MSEERTLILKLGQMITDRIKDEVSFLIEDIRNDKFWS